MCKLLLLYCIEIWRCRIGDVTSRVNLINSFDTSIIFCTWYIIKQVLLGSCSTLPHTKHLFSCKTDYIEQQDKYKVCSFVQEWNDYNLRWNESEYGGVKDLRITPNKLWKPDVLMYNR